MKNIPTSHRNAPDWYGRVEGGFENTTDATDVVTLIACVSSENTPSHENSRRTTPARPATYKHGNKARKG